MRKVRFFLLTKSLGLYINALSYVSPSRSKRVAYSWFSKPRDGKLRRETLPDMLSQASHETIAFGDDSIHAYVWKGSDEIVMLAHGWDSNSWRWERFLPYLLQSGRTVVAVDAPDHGLSTGDFSLPKYAAFLNEVAKKYTPNFLVGHSLGGAASIFYQHTYQNPRLQKLVLLGAPGELSTILSNYSGLLSLNRRSSELLNEYFVEHFKFHPTEFSGKLFGKNLKIKGLVAHDVLDTVVLFDEGKSIAEDWEFAQFIETNGLGHSMHDDDLYATIARFLFDD